MRIENEIPALQRWPWLSTKYIQAEEEGCPRPCCLDECYGGMEGADESKKIFLHKRKWNSRDAHPLNTSLIQRGRIWKSAAIRNPLTKNLEMQICATQLGGQVAATSFEPITWRALLKAPRRRTKRTRFCCFGIFFLPCCLCLVAFTWQRSHRRLRLRCNNCAFFTRKFNKLSRLGLTYTTKAGQFKYMWNTHAQRTVWRHCNLYLTCPRIIAGCLCF